MFSIMVMLIVRRNILGSLFYSMQPLARFEITVPFIIQRTTPISLPDLFYPFARYAIKITLI
jgi:hypothetical protein